ncbi:MAG: oxidoreductase, partial [Proteobacteria bacterium]|nr:oxidoreductase [Pseudomonadota bacterium]
MNAILHPYEVTQEEDMMEPLDFNRRSRLKDVDKSFKAEITNVIRLTEMEKLFQLRMVNEDEKNRFTFLPGQFLMVELP